MSRTRVSRPHDIIVSWKDALGVRYPLPGPEQNYKVTCPECDGFVFARFMDAHLLGHIVSAEEWRNEWIAALSSPRESP